MTKYLPLIVIIGLVVAIALGIRQYRVSTCADKGMEYYKSGYTSACVDSAGLLHAIN